MARVPGPPYPGDGHPTDIFPFNPLTHPPSESSDRLNDLFDYDLEDALDIPEPPRRTERQEAVQPGQVPELVHRSRMPQQANHLRQSIHTVQVQCSPTNRHHNSASTVCLTKVLELFPDISHKFVEELCTTRNADESLGKGDLSYIEKVIEDILTKSSYPKETKGVKRKNPVDEYEDNEPTDSAPPDDKHYLSLAVRNLSGEFPHIPANYVQQIMVEKKKLYHAYVFLATQENTRGRSAAPYEALKTPRRPQPKSALSAGIEERWPIYGHLKRELKAAKKKVKKDAAQSRKQREDEETERLNEEEHARTGSMVECQCCYADAPANRTVPCEGDELHFFCFSCIRMSAETQVGLMKHEMQCFDTGGCKAGFARPVLREALGASLMDKLESLQQQNEITQAGLDGLEGCPFCEFKAICQPVEENREFRCANPDCEMISCRLCKDETHIPKTCQEAKREKGVSERHLVEEAMSGALIRTCPTCGVKLIKEVGCNKMRCSNCRCLMCYTCKKDITKEGYHHFETRRSARGCQVYDDDPTLEAREVTQAEKTAIEQIRAENPNFSQEDLRINRPTDNARPRVEVRRPRPYCPPAPPPRLMPGNQALPPIRNLGNFPRAPPNMANNDAQVLNMLRRRAGAPYAANPQNMIRPLPPALARFEERLPPRSRPLPQPQGTPPMNIPNAANPPIGRVLCAPRVPRAPAPSPPAAAPTRAPPPPPAPAPARTPVPGPAPIPHDINPPSQLDISGLPNLYRNGAAPNRHPRIHTFSEPRRVFNANGPPVLPPLYGMQMQSRGQGEVIDLTGGEQRIRRESGLGS